MKKIKAHIIGEIISTNDSDAHSLYQKSVFGQSKSGKIQYMLSETLYLVEKNKLEVFQKNKLLDFKDLLNKLKRIDKKIHLKYPVYKDLREKGYIPKTALKFGADFRVYEKGRRPGNEHAKWVVFCEHESKTQKWNEFAAKNRVAHSTKKKLLLAILDEEGDVSYYEVGWVKP